jgi:hypothetical protein
MAAAAAAAATALCLLGCLVLARFLGRRSEVGWDAGLSYRFLEIGQIGFEIDQIF